MRKIILNVLVGVALSQCPGGTLLFNGQQVNCTCRDVYTKRLEPTQSGDDSIPIDFNSTIGIDDQQNLVINISFVDNKTDPTTNLDNPFSCIQPVFNKYGVNFGGTPTVQYPIIFSTYNDKTGYRTWSYKIITANFSTALIAGTNSSELLNYAGFFGIDFTTVEIVQFTIQYSFTIQVNLKTNTTTATSFNQLSNTQRAPCGSDNNCTANIQTSLQFCTTSDCERPTNDINLTLNQNFWLLLSITNIGFNQYEFRAQTYTLLLLNGMALFRIDSPTTDQVNIQAGKAIISYTVDFAYENVTICVYFSLFRSGSRRILAENANTTVISLNATSNSIDCIKYESGQNCVTCADQCIVNKGFSSSRCPLCQPSSARLSISITISMLMMLFMY